MGLRSAWQRGWARLFGAPPEPEIESMAPDRRYTPTPRDRQRRKTRRQMAIRSRRHNRHQSKSQNGVR